MCIVPRWWNGAEQVLGGNYVPALLLSSAESTGIHIILCRAEPRSRCSISLSPRLPTI